MANITVIGFGEAGTIFASELVKNHHVTVWDTKFIGDAGEAMRNKARICGVHAAGSLVEALENAEWIFSLVTAGNSLNLVLECQPLLREGQSFLDCNSVAPGTKRQAAECCLGRANYVDVAVMAPVPPKRAATPLLIGGETGLQAVQFLQQSGLNASFGSNQVGDVSAIKMCRSVMIKGLEALTTECLLAARHYGVEDEVLASLHASFPSLGWDGDFPHYMISRVAEHGVRRAEEMREVVKMIEDAGLPASMCIGTIATQQRLPERMTQRGVVWETLQPFDWKQTADDLFLRR